MQLKTDRELLESYATDRNDAAFAELVARYSPMVYRACLRVLGNANDAEDATQATFLVLARKAGSLRQEGRLNGWLHRVARQVALQALRVRADRERRQEHVAVAQESMTVDTQEVDRDVVFQAVDAELDGLSAILREAIVLRYLRGFSEQAAAAAAGCPLGTMKRRASDGIAMLRQRLAKRGVALSGVALAGLLTSEASAAVPETLLPSILAVVKTAAATTATATGATSTAAMLAKGAMKAMFIAKAKMVAAVAAASLMVAGGGAIVAQEVAQRKAAEQPPAAVVQPAVNVDEIDLMTVTSLTPAQAAAIVKRQEQKPWYRHDTEQETDADLLAAGATPEQVKRLRAEMRGLRSRSRKYSFDPVTLAEFFSRTTSLEWMRLGNRFANSLALPALTTLTPEVAAVLARFRGQLDVSGLAVLTPETAAALVANCNDYLHLRGLKTLTPETAAALRNCKRKEKLQLLDLSGLTTLTPETVAELVKPYLGSRQDDRGGDVLILSGLTRVTPEVAAELANCWWSELDLSGLTTLTPEAATALGKPRALNSMGIVSPHIIILNGLTTLNADVAAALAQIESFLYLNGLTTLSGGTAKALTESKVRRTLLALDGLTLLDADTAKALAAFSGDWLDLKGLTMLTPEVASALANFRGRTVSLVGLTLLDADTAKALAAFSGDMLVLSGLTTLTPEVAAVLANFRGQLLLSGLTALSSDTARTLAESNARSLYLDRLTVLDADTATALAEFKGKGLHLTGLKTLTPEVAKVLATCKATVLLPQHLKLPKP